MLAKGLLRMLGMLKECAVVLRSVVLPELAGSGVNE